MDNVIDSLKKFGMTDYEAKTYNALMNLDISTATEISKESNIPRVRVYDVLSSLARKGWIKIIEDTPLKYTSLPLKNIKEKLVSTQNQIIKAGKFIEGELKSNTKEKEYSLSNTSNIIITTKGAINVLVEEIKRSRKEITISYLKNKWFDSLFPYLKLAKKRGIKVKVILNENEHNIHLQRKLMTIGKVKVGIENLPHGNLLIDHSFYANLYYNNDQLQINTLGYSKCISCLKAWIRREWETIEYIK